MFAIIQTGGKQYKVSEGDIIYIEKLDETAGSEVTFDKVLTVSDATGLKFGAPYVAGAMVIGKVISQGKNKKIYVFKYKSKKNEKSGQGHRQPFTKVQITKIA